MAFTAVRTAAQRAAKKKADDEEARKSAQTSAETDSEPDEDDDEDMDAKADDDADPDDTGDAPPVPPKKNARGKKASATPLNPRAAERQRIQAIMASDEAEGREDYAEYLAMETDFSAKQAIALLSRAPQAAVQASEAPAKPGRNRFDQAMADATAGDGKIASRGKGKATNVATEDMDDDAFVASVVGFAAQYGLVKA